MRISKNLSLQKKIKINYLPTPSFFFTFCFSSNIPFDPAKDELVVNGGEDASVVVGGAVDEVEAEREGDVEEKEVGVEEEGGGAKEGVLLKGTLLNGALLNVAECVLNDGGVLNEVAVPLLKEEVALAKEVAAAKREPGGYEEENKVEDVVLVAGGEVLSEGERCEADRAGEGVGIVVGRDARSWVGCCWGCCPRSPNTKPYEKPCPLGGLKRGVEDVVTGENIVGVGDCERGNGDGNGLGDSAKDGAAEEGACGALENIEEVKGLGTGKDVDA